MDLHPDFRDLLAEFARSGVRYALVGGYAVAHHAKPRATKDLDLVSARGDNRERVIAMDDLIANKKAAARPQDLADADLLDRMRTSRESP